MARSARWPRALRSWQAAGLVAAVATLAFAGCRTGEQDLWSSAFGSVEECEVERVRAIPYYQGPEFDSFRHRLDLYYPRGKVGYPVVVLVHGGAWMLGDNRSLGLQSAVGEFLAAHGIGAVLPNYRLSPGVKHPAHVRDIARAVAWTHACIADHGGDPEQIFLAGHSAGGHLVSLLGTDETYLAAEGLAIKDIRGVISISGVYELPPDSLEVALGGASPSSFRWRQVTPLRRSPAWPGLRGLPGIPLCLNVFGPAFGNDPRIREEASPIHHVRPGLPPFLILYAENDLPTLPAMAERFCQALRDQGCSARVLQVPGRNHNSILFHAIRADDPVAEAMLAFLHGH
jgi:acetyl esterase/lipase